RLCTLLLDSCARIYGVYTLVDDQLTDNDSGTGGLGSFLFAFVAMNGVINVFVYAGGQKEVRKAIFSLVGLGNLVVTSEEA
ncbi:hypothetical protein PMAYCL1PPCAC_25389, partial [Pristionchus mayeri]